ncbi:MAG TPA: A24 family peptidase [Candidatus Nanoarchaeia archaeon]|nr:A24 family peptidase [Candidatus Nanoarchaeia archaeon]
MTAEIFLFALAFIWLAVASLQDIKKREVANWLSFSLILFALAFRGFYALFNADFWFFLNGVIGLAIFYAIATALYYARLFAGGDLKLLMALGAVLPVYGSFLGNIIFLLIFIFLFMAAGSVYSLIYTAFLVAGRRKEFAAEIKQQFRNNKSLFTLSLIAAVFALIAVLISFSFFQFAGEGLLFVFPPLIFALPFLYVYAKAVEEACMIKNVRASELAIGDWLYKPVRAGKKIIEPDWQGLSEEEIRLLKRHKKKVLIKQGVPFVPSFLMAFIFLVWLRYSYLYAALLGIF